MKKQRIQFPLPAREGETGFSFSYWVQENENFPNLGAKSRPRDFAILLLLGAGVTPAGGAGRGAPHFEHSPQSPAYLRRSTAGSNVRNEADPPIFRAHGRFKFFKGSSGGRNGPAMRAGVDAMFTLRQLIS